MFQAAAIPFEKRISG